MLSVVMSGLNAAQKQLEVTSNNIANAGTVGFEGSEASFAVVFANDHPANPETAVGSGVVTAQVLRSTAQGSMSTTGNVTDLAIAGTGYFIFSPSGSTIQSYTRAGNFSLKIDPSDASVATCALTDASSISWANLHSWGTGASLMAQFSGNIPAADITNNLISSSGSLQGITIDFNGVVTAIYFDAANTKITIGQLALAQFANPSALKPIGNTDFAASASSGSPKVVAAGAPRSGNIMSGILEQSNVDITAQLIEMIKSQQLYNGNARMLQIAVEVGSRITDKI